MDTHTDERTLGEMFAELSRETRTLVQQELELVKTEITEKASAMGKGAAFIVGGGLIAYDVNIPDLHRNAAQYVDKILKGAKPSDLPVQQPTKLSLVINLKAAKALGIKLPPALITRADKVIE